jgi:hypothetical protein
MWPITALSVVMQNPNVECLFLRRHLLLEKIISVERPQVSSYSKQINAATTKASGHSVSRKN